MVQVGLVAAAAALVAGCGGRTAAPASPVGRPCRGAAPPRTYEHVILVVLENHSFSAVAGHSHYLNRLAAACGLATDYSAVAHPSLPNYLALTSGSTHGISSDCTDCPISAPSIFGQLHGAWRSYLESIPTPGFEGAFSGGYAKKHNPAAYYEEIATAYAQRAVPLTRLRSDLEHDALSRFSLVVGSDNRVYTVVASRSVRPHTVVATPFDHYSLLRTAEQLLGLPCLANACRAQAM